MNEHQKRQRQRRVRLQEIEDEMDQILVKREELNQQEVQLMFERRSIRAALVEPAKVRHEG